MHLTFCSMSSSLITWNRLVAGLHHLWLIAAWSSVSNNCAAPFEIVSVLKLRAIIILLLCQPHMCMNTKGNERFTLASNSSFPLWLMILFSSYLLVWWDSFVKLPLLFQVKFDKIVELKYWGFLFIFELVF